MNTGNNEEQTYQTEAYEPELFVAHQLLEVLLESRLFLESFPVHNLLSSAKVLGILISPLFSQDTLVVGILLFVYSRVTVVFKDLLLGSPIALLFEGYSVLNINIFAWGDEVTGSAWKDCYSLDIERPLPIEVLLHIEGQSVAEYYTKWTSK